LVAAQLAGDGDWKAKSPTQGVDKLDVVHLCASAVRHVAQPITVTLPSAATQAYASVGGSVREELGMTGTVESPQKWALCFVVARGEGGVQVGDETEGLVGQQISREEVSNGGFGRGDVKA